MPCFATRLVAVLSAFTAMIALPGVSGSFLYKKKHFISSSSANPLELNLQPLEKITGTLNTTPADLKAQLSNLLRGKPMDDYASIDELAERIVQSSNGHSLSLHVYIDAGEATLSLVSLESSYTSLDRIKINYDVRKATAKHNATKQAKHCVRKRILRVIRKTKCHWEQESRALTAEEHTEVMQSLRSVLQEAQQAQQAQQLSSA
jgi:hypothetical protein